MKFISKSDVPQIKKPEGVLAVYYLFNDYELQYNEQQPQTTQVWHHHEKIWETLYIIDGELIAKWRENGQEHSRKLTAGDVIETELTPHTFINQSEGIVRILAVKHIKSANDYRHVFKADKFLD